ncbi:MAG: hypothetical protein F6K18_31965 [Okeania sp. SIO2C2]|uniref:hypothetical protein n=1 Tax=Okeania sp. SIO2C2 TaxID=2607787 RepID=UPI0013B99AD0|nr:hypothetical protein [Okeania sp. SIO2C2]NEP91060.1 hypothetical protein [Okeania sp. SIO2C2]
MKKETGDRRQETGGKLHGDSLPQVILNTPVDGAGLILCRQRIFIRNTKNYANIQISPSPHLPISPSPHPPISPSPHSPISP